jgi:hypothetical protein
VRTVRRDLAAGRLRARTLKNGQRRVTAAAADRYRATQQLWDAHVKPEEFARLCGWSIRTLRRYIAAGYVRVIRVSPRRFYPQSEAYRLRRASIDDLTAFARR